MFKHMNRRKTSLNRTPHESCEECPCIIDASNNLEITIRRGNYIQ